MKMDQSTGKFIQTGVIAMMLIFFAATFGFSIEIDRPECEGVVCSAASFGEIACPEDSHFRIIPPIVMVNQENTTANNTSANVESNNRKRRDISTEVPLNLENGSAATTAFLPEIATNGYVGTELQNAATSESNQLLCCLATHCVCKEICNIPSCHNTSLVLIETTPRSNIPGKCCAEYKCDFEPNCTENIHTEGSWLTDCQVCRCVAGQKICHRSCDEIRPPPANCLSQNLKRSYSNGESWKEDECTSCECVNGEKKCLTSFCKALNCANKVKLSGECCPICVDPVTTLETTSYTSKIESTISTESSVVIKPVPAIVPPCNDPHETIVHVIESNNEKCILYALIACLTVLTGLFIGLYCHARSRQRSYRPVPIFDSNFNKIKSIVTS